MVREHLLAIVALVLVLNVSCQRPAARQAGVREEPATITYSGEVGTAVVAKFYEALIQEEPITRQQEQALFLDEGGIRGFLLMIGEKDSDPIVLRRFREYRHLFIPKMERGKIPRVSISSLYQVSRWLDQPRNDGVVSTGTVKVVIANDDPLTKHHFNERSIHFTVKNGKINPDAIWMEYGSELASDWIRDTLEGPEGLIRNAGGNRLAETQESANRVLLPMLRPTMSREQVEKWLGAPFKSGGFEDEGILWCLYYIADGTPAGRHLMSVEYERRDGKWMFVRYGGPHKPNDK